MMLMKNAVVATDDCAPAAAADDDDEVNMMGIVFNYFLGFLLYLLSIHTKLFFSIVVSIPSFICKFNLKNCFSLLLKFFKKSGNYPI